MTCPLNNAILPLIGRAKNEREREREKERRHKHHLVPAGLYDFLLRLPKFIRLNYGRKKREANIVRLAREIKPVIDKYAATDYAPPSPPSIPKIVWALWYDDANMPEVVACCLERMRAELPERGYELHILDKTTISDYIDMSDIMPSLESGEIFLQAFSDILRMRLLWRYGGFWLDSTIALLDPAALDRMVSSVSFISLQINKPGNAQHRTAWSSFFWGSAPGNPLFAYTAEAFAFYLNKHRKMMVYSQLDCTIHAGYRHISFIKALIDNLPDYSQGTPAAHHALFRLRSEPYELQTYEEIAAKWPIQKLPRRKEYQKSIITPDGECETYYGHIASDWLMESTRIFAKPSGNLKTYI